jgi:hypothetical protein
VAARDRKPRQTPVVFVLRWLSKSSSAFLLGAGPAGGGARSVVSDGRAHYRGSHTSGGWKICPMKAIPRDTPRPGDAGPRGARRRDARQPGCESPGREAADDRRAPIRVSPLPLARTYTRTCISGSFGAGINKGRRFSLCASPPGAVGARSPLLLLRHLRPLRPAIIHAPTIARFSGKTRFTCL